VLDRQTSSHHFLLEVGQLHIPIPVPPNRLPGMNKVLQIEVLEPIVADGLALSSSTNLSEKRIREEAISPVKLVTIDVEGDGGGDCLTREAGGMRWFRSLTTPRTRSRSTGQSLVMGRGDGGGLPMDHTEDVVHTGRRVIEGHASLLWVVVRADLSDHLKYS